MLTTFFHEYGHALYRHSTSDKGNPVDSEAEAIRFSLATLEAEGLVHLAYREANSVKNMSHDEPYKSALKKLAQDPHWRKFAPPEFTQ